jgi:hypothetical protein
MKRILAALFLIVGNTLAAKVIEVSDLDAVYVHIDRAFEPSYHLSAERDEEEGFVIRFATFGGANAPPERTIYDEGIKPISEDQFLRIASMFLAAEMEEKAKSLDYLPESLEGATWTIEGRKGNFKYSVSEWEPPPESDFRKIGKVIMEAAGYEQKLIEKIMIQQVAAGNGR